MGRCPQGSGPVSNDRKEICLLNKYIRVDKHWHDANYDSLTFIEERTTKKLLGVPAEFACLVFYGMRPFVMFHGS